MRRYLAERAGVKPEREFALLAALGKDLPGALRVEALAGRPDVEQQQLAGLDRAATEQTDDTALRFSLAGVQLKFSAIQERPGGLTIPASGQGGAWVVKLPSTEFSGVPENEFSMMTLAKQIGITVPPMDLVPVRHIKGLPAAYSGSEHNAFVIERFDRTSDGGAVHIEDFAQVFAVYPEQKYNRASMRNLLQVLAAETNDDDIAEFVRRLVFCNLIGNGDMHLKNWSLMYPDQRKARLAPAYDLLSTIPYLPNDRMALKVSRTREFSAMDEDELTHLASKCAVPANLVLETARATVEAFREHWQVEQSHLPLSPNMCSRLEAHLKTLPLYR